MRRTLPAWMRLACSALVFAVLIWRLGTGPFIDGLRTIDGGTLAAATGIALLTTVGYAWRWKIVARGLGLDLPLPAAVAGYYRSMFVNAALPGGIVGDVHRGASHGRDVSDVGHALRAVAWERIAGQVIQVLLTVVVLLALPSPVRPLMPWVAIAVLGAVFALLFTARHRTAGTRSAWARLRRAAASDIHDGLLARRAWPGIVLASTLGVAGHAATFLIAARTAGITAAPSRVLPIVLIALAAMMLPSIGGWGSREGVAAWVFGAAGLGVQRGVAAAVVYGVMVLVASLPGAVVLVVAWVRRNRLLHATGSEKRRPKSRTPGEPGALAPGSRAALVLERRLVGGEARGSRAGGHVDRAQRRQVSAIDGEFPDLPRAGLVDVEVLPVGAQARILRTRSTGTWNRGRTEEAERPVREDRVAGDAA